MRQNNTPKPLIALIGAQPSSNLPAYIDQITSLVSYFLVGLMVTWGILAQAVLYVKVIEHPIKANLLLLQQNWLFLFMGFACIIAASLFVYMEGKKSVKHMKGLVALTRADPEQPPPVSLTDYVEVSMPSWLQRLPQVDISDEMLDTLQQHINPEEPWMKNLAAYLRQYAPEHSPSISILVSLGDCVTVSVLGSNGKRQQFTISQEQTAAIVGILALQEKGAWMLRKHVIHPIYGEDERNVNKHTSRLNDALNKAVQKVVGQLGKGESNQLSNAEENKLKLIEYDETGKENLWRLLITCEVEIFPELLSLYEQIMAAQNNPNVPSPKHETLYQGCRHIMEHYRKGLFGSYQKKYLDQYQYWSWAKEYYTGYQDKCLAVLQYAAKREWAYAMEHKNEPDVLHASIRQTAQLYSWKFQVALGVIANLTHGEQAVCKCLKLYRMIGDLATARSIFRTYATFMKKQNDNWKLPAKISEIWPEATSLSEQDSQS